MKKIIKISIVSILLMTLSAAGLLFAGVNISPTRDTIWRGPVQSSPHNIRGLSMTLNADYSNMNCAPIDTIVPPRVIVPGSGGGSSRPSGGVVRPPSNGEVRGRAP